MPARRSATAPPRARRLRRPAESWHKPMSAGYAFSLKTWSLIFQRPSSLTKRMLRNCVFAALSEQRRLISLHENLGRRAMHIGPRTHMRPHLLRVRRRFAGPQPDPGVRVAALLCLLHLHVYGEDLVLRTLRPAPDRARSRHLGNFPLTSPAWFPRKRLRDCVIGKKAIYRH